MSLKQKMELAGLTPGETARLFGVRLEDVYRWQKTNNPPRILEVLLDMAPSFYAMHGVEILKVMKARSDIMLSNSAQPLDD